MLKEEAVTGVPQVDIGVASAIRRAGRLMTLHWGTSIIQEGSFFLALGLLCCEPLYLIPAWLFFLVFQGLAPSGF